MARIQRLPKPLRVAALITFAIVVPCGIGIVAGYLITQRRTS